MKLSSLFVTLQPSYFKPRFRSSRPRVSLVYKSAHLSRSKGATITTMKKSVVVIVILVLCWVLLTQLVAPIMIKNRLTKTVPNLKLNSVSVSLLDVSRLTLQDIHITHGTRGLADIEASIPTIAINVDLLALLDDQLIIENLIITKLDVIYTDGELPRPPKAPPGPEDKEAKPILVKAVHIDGAKFAYRRVLYKEASLITLNDIQLHATVDEEVRVKSNFQLEKSGNIQLNFNFPVKQKKLTADVQVFIKDQNLADLNVFFKSNDGVILRGIMQKGDGRVVVDGDQAKSRVKAIYKNFDAKLVSNEDQGGLEVFFTNIGIALTTKEKNKSKKREEVITQREPNESIVHFILTGLKVAALEVASSSD